MRSGRIFAAICLVAAPCRGPAAIDAGEPPAPPAAPVDWSEDLRPFPTPEYGRLLALGLRGTDRPPSNPERALVAAGLRHLVRAQAANGMWECVADGTDVPANDVGTTALAVLAILGAGWAPDASDAIGAAASKGLDALAKRQVPGGSFDRVANTRAFTYGHAFATLAFVEAFAMTGDPTTHRVAQGGLDYVCEARNPYFGWRYGTKPGDNDTAVSGSMWVTLYAARLVNDAAVRAGLRPAFQIDLEDAIDGVRAWIEKMTNAATGGVGYQRAQHSGAARPEDVANAFPPEMSESMTAIGVFVRRTTGERGDSPAIRRGVARILARLPQSKTADGSIDFFAWYYASWALRLIDPKETKWSSALTATLTALQTAKGDETHWETRDAWSGDGGAMYTTTMALLSLENRWRYPPDPDDRQEVLAAIGGDARAGVQVLALRSLALRPVKDSAARITQALKSPLVEVRRAAAEALAESATSAEEGPLSAVIGDSDEATRVLVVRALGAVGTKGVASLLRALTDAAPAVRREAAASLVRLGPGTAPTATDPLRALLADADPGARVAAAHALNVIASAFAATTPVLVAALASTDAAVRRSAAVALASAGPKAADAAAALEKAADDPDLWSRTEIVAALIAIRPPLLIDASRLVPVLGSPDPAVRRRACDVLARMGPALHPAVVALAQRLTDADPGVRRRAAQALGAAGREARDAVPALRFALLDPVRGVAAAAKAALIQAFLPFPVSPATPIPTLVAATGDKDPLVRLRSAEILGESGVGASAEALVALRACAKDADAGVRAAALRSLARLTPSDEATRAAILAGLGDESDVLRTAALDVLAPPATKLPEATPLLVRIVTHRGAAEVIAAVERLGAWNASEAPVVEVMRTSSSRKLPDAVRLAVVRSLLAMRPATESIVMALVGAGAAVSPALEYEVGSLVETGLRSDPVLRDLVVSMWIARPEQPELLEFMKRGSAATGASAAKAFGDANSAVRRHVARFFESLYYDAASAIPILVENLRYDEPDNCEQIQRFLSRSKDVSVRAPLMRALTHKSALVRGGAAMVIGGLYRSEKNSPALSALRAASATEKDAGAAAAINEAIRRFPAKK